MNKLQKFMVLLWVLATLLCIGLAVGGGWGGAAAFGWMASLIVFWGLAWVLADQRRSKRTFALALGAGGLLLAAVVAAWTVTLERQLAAFQNLTSDMTAQDVMRLHGRPAKVEGSGVLFLHYRLVDGSEIVVICASELRVSALIYEGKQWFPRLRDRPPPKIPGTKN